jgi:hypothetical protein
MAYSTHRINVFGMYKEGKYNYVMRYWQMMERKEVIAYLPLLILHSDKGLCEIIY